MGNRYDEAGQRRLKTAEIIADEKPWIPNPSKHLKKYRVASLSTAYGERDLLRRVKGACGTREAYTSGAFIIYLHIYVYIYTWK